jgi:hypothetical protein
MIVMCRSYLCLCVEHVSLFNILIHWLVSLFISICNAFNYDVVLLCVAMNYVMTLIS